MLNTNFNRAGSFILVTPTITRNGVNWAAITNQVRRLIVYRIKATTFKTFGITDVIITIVSTSPLKANTRGYLISGSRINKSMIKIVLLSTSINEIDKNKSKLYEEISLFECKPLTTELLDKLLSDAPFSTSN